VIGGRGSANVNIHKKKKSDEITLYSCSVQCEPPHKYAYGRAENRETIA
jgi:hypothetical protein